MIRLFETSQQPQEGRFPATTGSQDSHDLTFGNLHRDVLDGDCFAKGLCQVPQFNN
jgi:hypothetical protein